MGRISLLLLLFLLLLGMFLGCSWSQESDSAAVYIVNLKQSPASHSPPPPPPHPPHFAYNGELSVNTNNRTIHAGSGSGRLNRLDKPDSNISRTGPHHGSYIARFHDSLLRRVLRGEKYLKLYSYHYLINGFAVLVTPQQAEKLSRRREVANVILDFSVRTATTHTPQFLGLPQGAWPQEGGYETAGEGIVIGFIDTGIDPGHVSFSDGISENTYPVPEHFSGICEVTRDFPSGSCNRKLVGARHFAASAITRGIFNATKDYASPFDGDGHGTHTASIAAGNHGIPVVVAGQHFGNASGMAPRSHIAVYKALYKSFGGFAADVVAAIDQAAQDGVDIISLSITPNRRPPGIATFFNPIDMALLSAVKAGIFVVQAAGNTGPSPKSISSFSPWIFTVGAAAHDRVYSNSIVLGNNITIPGVGLAPGTDGDSMCTMVSAIHALNDTTAAKDIYVGECQDSSSLNQDIVRGNLLICSYSIRFVLGLSTIKHALQTAKNLSAAGVVFHMDPFIIGFQLNPVPMELPGIIIPSSNDSKILLQYYNSSLERDGSSKRIIKFGAVACISGGLKANYSNSAPKVMYYSARGPDPEDSFLDDADILKPNLVAPGNFIWAAWSSGGTDSIEFLGEEFAMMSGTSMAAPHVAGLAALIKKKFPTFSPSAIGSALSTTASLHEKDGGPIMAQRAYANPDLNQSPATSFDMGSGFVNATAALDPGLIFDSIHTKGKIQPRPVAASIASKSQVQATPDLNHLRRSTRRSNKLQTETEVKDPPPTGPSIQKELPQNKSPVNPLAARAALASLMSKVPKNLEFSFYQKGEKCFTNSLDFTNHKQVNLESLNVTKYISSSVMNNFSLTGTFSSETEVASFGPKPDNIVKSLFSTRSAAGKPQDLDVPSTIWTKDCEEGKKIPGFTNISANYTRSIAEKNVSQCREATRVTRTAVQKVADTSVDNIERKLMSATNSRRFTRSAVHKEEEIKTKKTEQAVKENRSKSDETDIPDHNVMAQESYALKEKHEVAVGSLDTVRDSISTNAPKNLLTIERRSKKNDIEGTPRVLEIKTLGNTRRMTRSAVHKDIANTTMENMQGMVENKCPENTDSSGGNVSPLGTALSLNAEISLPPTEDRNNKMKMSAAFKTTQKTEGHDDGGNSRSHKRKSTSSQTHEVRSSPRLKFLPRTRSQSKN